MIVVVDMQIEPAARCGVVATKHKLRQLHHTTLLLDQESLLLKISLKAFCSTKTTKTTKIKNYWR
jgi:hypothetical protein